MVGGYRILGKRTREALYHAGTGAVAAYNLRNCIVPRISTSTNRSFRSTGSQSMTFRRRKNVRSGQGITNQFDRRTIYVRKSMPKRRRKRWVRFKRKVNAASEKDLGSKTVVFNDQINRVIGGSTATVGKHMFTQLALYSIQHNNLPYLKDIGRICAAETSEPTTAKFLFQSGILDITVVNSSLDAVGVPMGVEVDVYEITANRTFENLPTANKSLADVFDDAVNDTSLIGAASPIDVDSRGSTPFDFPSAISSYGLKIWRKQKYFLPPGQTFTYQLRDPRRHVFDKAYVTDMSGSNYRRVTRWLWILTKPLPGYNDGISQEPPFAVISLNIGATRKYLYKKSLSNYDQDALNP